MWSGQWRLDDRYEDSNDFCPFPMVVLSLCVYLCTCMRVCSCTAPHMCKCVEVEVGIGCHSLGVICLIFEAESLTGLELSK